MSLLLDGTEHLDHGFADGGLERAVALAGEVGLDLLEALAGAGGVDLHEVGHAGLVGRVKAHAVLAGVGVGDGALELAHDVLRLLQQVHAAVGILVGLAHLAGRILQAHDARAHAGDVRLGHLEGLAVDVVEAYGHVARQLDVLLLVVADGDEVGLVEQDVGRHARGVSEQAAVYVVGVLGALVLELRHAAELAEHGVAVEHPAELRVAGVVALHKERDLVGVEAAGDVLRKLLHSAAAQVGGHLAHGYGVHVHDAVIGVVVVDHVHPVPDGAHVGAERQITGGLDAGEHGFSFIHRKRPLILTVWSARGARLAYFLSPQSAASLAKAAMLRLIMSPLTQ